MNTLKNLGKPQFNAMVLSQRDETKATIESLIDEVKEMNTIFKKLEAAVSIFKTVNILLMKNSVDIERQGWTNAQYFHREYLQIAGIPTSIA